MDFFQSQDTARINTTRLVIFFFLAVLSLIIITNLLVMLLFGYLEMEQQDSVVNMIIDQFDWEIFLLIGAGVSLVVFGGSMYKTMALSGGGTTVAESLGGRRIDQSTEDLHERKVLNVVEEMAIASGIPVPPVYLLEGEEGINAFAAGFTPADAVIGVTRGTIAFLTREELQGVIAHEFSHILHGDMRINIRLIGVLHGILLLGLIGYYILWGARGGSSKNAGAIFGLGIGLIVIGFAGSFFGNMIKASVSRQREFLADASAVQFTRNNDGIAGALKKIGGYASGSVIESPAAPSMSHAFFNTGIESYLGSLTATHPPLDIRIKRLDPGWDGVFPTVGEEVNEDITKASVSKQNVRSDAMKKSVVATVAIAEIIDSIGHTDLDKLNYAATLLSEIPEKLKQAVHEPYSARAVIYCLVIDKDPEIQRTQFQHLEKFADDGIYELCQDMFHIVNSLDIKFRLPLIDLALPSLRTISQKQYELFKSNLLSLITADDKMDLFEWALQKILLHNLEKEFSKKSKKAIKHRSLRALKKHSDVLISMLIHVFVKDVSEHGEVVSSVKQESQFRDLSLIEKSEINFSALGAAIDALALLKPLQKPVLLKACLRCLTYDQEYSSQEREIMRAIANTLDCPIPIFID